MIHCAPEGVRTPMRRLAMPLLWVFLVMNLWLLLGHLVLNRDVGDRSLAHPEAVLTAALLVLAPALIFLPIASHLPAPFYDVEAILGWGTLGFVVIFFQPGDTLTQAQFLALLLPLMVALASITTLIAYFFVRRIQHDQERASSFLQARRIGYMVALALVTLGLLSTLKLLTPFNGALVVAVAVLVESLVLASRPSRRQPA